MFGVNYPRPDDPNSFLDTGILTMEPTQFESALCRYVNAALTEAKGHKGSIGVTACLAQDLRARLSQYDPSFRKHIEPGTDVYIPLTNTKCRAAEAWIKDILANAEERPWVLEPTPDPELSTAMEDVVLDELEREFFQAGAQLDVRARAAHLKDLARGIMQKVAKERVSNMENLIHDQLTEGYWRKAFTQFVRDLVTYQTAFIKGPTLQPQRRMQWNRGAEIPQEVNSVLPVVECVHPQHVFPSPDMSDPQDGSYIIHAKPVTSTDLLKLTTVSGVDDRAVRAAIAQNAQGNVPEVSEVSAIDALNGVRKDYTTHTRFYELVMFYGRVPGSLLTYYGIPNLDPQYEYEAEVWVVGKQVIRAILNPYPLQRRPFYATSFIKNGGSIWGQSLPGVLRDIQRMVNGMARALVKNTAFSAGPITEVDISRLEDEAQLKSLSPFQVVHTKASFAGASRAVNFHQPQNIAAALANLQSYYTKVADDVSGIPAYVLGNPDVAGAGRTLGGLSLLMGNAAKGIKAVVSNVDRDITEPLVEAYYYLNLLYNEDPTIKADAVPKARGASGLLARELNQARTLESFQIMAPFIGSLIPPEGGSVILRDILRQNGYDPDRVIPDFERERQLIARSESIAGNPAGVSTQPGTPAPALDNRSAPQAIALANAQLPPPVPEG